MYYITSIAQEITMATTPLMRVPNYQICWPRKEKVQVDTRPPRMNWVVVSDEDRSRRMQMRWQPSADDR